MKLLQEKGVNHGKGVKNIPNRDPLTYIYFKESLLSVSKCMCNCNYVIVYERLNAFHFVNEIVASFLTMSPPNICPLH